MISILHTFSCWVHNIIYSSVRCFFPAVSFHSCILYWLALSSPILLSCFSLLFNFHWILEDIFDCFGDWNFMINFFSDKVSLYSRPASSFLYNPHWPQILLPWSPECWEFGHTLQCTSLTLLTHVYFVFYLNQSTFS
jgi:hypothetical protein